MSDIGANWIAAQSQSLADESSKKTTSTNIKKRRSNNANTLQSVKKRPPPSQDIGLCNASESQRTISTHLKQDDFSVGRYIAVDCEMVEVDSYAKEALARVSLVNFHGNVILDEFVKPTAKVTDYRTFVSGIRPRDLVHARDFLQVRNDVAKIVTDTILIGHAIKHDLQVLQIDHPRHMVRDTSNIPQFLPNYHKKGRIGLKKLAKEQLGWDIQKGEHSSVEDAKATMLLYRKFKDQFEAKARLLKMNNKRNKRNNSK